MNTMHERTINLLHPTLDLKFIAETVLLDIRARIYRSGLDGRHFYTIEMAASPAITLYPLGSVFALAVTLKKMGEEMAVFSEAAPPDAEEPEPEAAPADENGGDASE